MAWTDIATVSGSDAITSTRQNEIINNIAYNRSPLVEETLNIADIQTTSTTYTDATGVTDTITTTGTTLRIVVMGALRTSTPGDKAVVTLSVDGTQVTSDTDGLVFCADSQAGYPFYIGYTATGLTAGAHTVQVRFKGTSGSTAVIYNPSIQLIDAA